MTYFQVNKTSELHKKPFVSFSKSEDRAHLMSFGGPSSNRRRRKRSKSQGRKRTRSVRRGRRTKSRITKVRVVNGRVALRVTGYPGYQRVGASQLIRFVPLNKLRAAAKRALGASGVKRHRRRRRRHRRRSQP